MILNETPRCGRELIGFSASGAELLLDSAEPSAPAEKLSPVLELSHGCGAPAPRTAYDDRASDRGSNGQSISHGVGGIESGYIAHPGVEHPSGPGWQVPIDLIARCVLHPGVLPLGNFAETMVDNGSPSAHHRDRVRTKVLQFDVNPRRVTMPGGGEVDDQSRSISRTIDPVHDSADNADHRREGARCCSGHDEPTGDFAEFREFWHGESIFPLDASAATTFRAE